MFRPLLVSLAFGGAVGALLPHLLPHAQACSCMTHASESLNLSFVAVEQTAGDEGDLDAEAARWDVPMLATQGMTGNVNLYQDPSNTDLSLNFSALEETP